MNFATVLVRTRMVGRFTRLSCFVRTDTVIQDMTPAYSQDRSMNIILLFNLCSTATRLQCRSCRSRLYAAVLPRPVYESSFWLSGRQRGVRNVS